MHSRLFTIDLGLFGSDYSIPFPSYFVLLLTGFLFATIVGVVWAKRVGQDPDVVVDLGLAMLLAGVAGARILHVFADGHLMDYVHMCTDPSKVEWQITRAECLSNDNGVWNAVKGVCKPKEARCFAWAQFYTGGLAYYGGFIGASIAAWYLLKADKFPFWKAADMAGFAIPIGLAFGRMGCLLAGCCFGAPTDGSLALTFPAGSPAWDAQLKAKLINRAQVESLPVHPAQIYEAGVAITIAAICLLWVHGRKKYDGQVFVTFVVLYAIGRFLLEFLRADDRGAWLGLSTSQLIGLGLAAAALFLHRRLSHLAQTSSQRTLTSAKTA
jgi:phosphatidylglycerol:prolipoprotein diacylglycerol transferase